MQAHLIPAYPGHMLTIREALFDDPAAAGLWAAQQAELAERYGEPDLDSDLTGSDLIVSLVGELDGQPIACALLRWLPDAQYPGAAEVKRMYVTPEHRGHGYSRTVMAHIEAVARAAGATHVVLETGVKQPEAVGLYKALGYTDIEPWGEYRCHESSVCMGQELT